MQRKEDDKTKIFIIDDDSTARRRLRDLIDEQPDLVICGEAASAYTALPLLAKSKADIVLLDLMLESFEGLELVKKIKNLRSNILILIISMCDELFYAERSLRKGASGYIMKNESTSKLIEAIRVVLDGRPYLGEPVHQSILTRVSGGMKKSDALHRTLDDREKEIFRMMGERLNREEISKNLRVGARIIQGHQHHLLSKLQLKSEWELIHCARDWVSRHPRGIIKPEPDRPNPL
jgi:DNA-binding NarL/FixJ family response regulator